MLTLKTRIWHLLSVLKTTDDPIEISNLHVFVKVPPRLDSMLYIPGAQAVAFDPS
jgi:hypothetical protein